jgi:hypothetical protein
MKTKTKKQNYVQELFKLLMAVGLIALLFAPGAAAEAKNSLQTGGVTAPLASQLTWNDLGSAERSFPVNGKTVTLSGNAFGAVEEFNLESNEAVATYYTSPSLALIGWRQVDNFPQSNGVSTLYFRDGVFALVEFSGCKDAPALACLTVWESVSTDLVPQSPKFISPNTVPFDKTSPANHTSNLAASVPLVWNPYGGANLNHYRYCMDTVNNATCDASGGWTSVWSGTTVTVSSLVANTTYYWNVEAVLTDGTKIQTNGGDWWYFTVGTVVSNPPSAFSKNLPSNAVAGQSATPTLTWGASTYATSYSYCVDTIINTTCDTNWVSTGTSTFVSLVGGLAPSTYYWQARATNALGFTDANSGTWWSFTVAAGPVNDTRNTALAFSIIPSASTRTVITTAATIDSGTTNPCSPGLGYASVWYSYTAPATRRIYVDTFGTNYDTFIAVWTKNINDTLNLITCNDNSSGLLQSSVNFAVTNGTTYYIQAAQKNPGTTPTLPPGGTLVFNVTTFADVNASNPSWKYVEGIKDVGITNGCATSPDLLYCPANSVTRAEMAVFLLRAEHGSSFTPGTPPITFTDTSTNWAKYWIEVLKSEGITTGCGPTTYCPDQKVTRAEMAAFLLRAKHGMPYTPPSAGSSTGFTDVPITHWAADWIKQLAVESITLGCGPGLYCPDAYATREQMAIFLSRTFSIPTFP